MAMLVLGFEHDSTLELEARCRRGPTVPVREYEDRPRRVTVRIIGPTAALARLRAEIEAPLAARGVTIVDREIVVEPTAAPEVTVTPR